jgi:hypothetical protein
MSKRAVVYSVIPSKRESRLSPGNDEKDKKSLIAIKKSFPPGRRGECLCQDLDDGCGEVAPCDFLLTFKTPVIKASRFAPAGLNRL